MLAEPVTTLTDYAMALEAGFLGVALLQENKRNFQRSRFFWGIAFGWVTIAAAAGGTSHGFAPILTLSVLNQLWLVMGYAIGCASFSMLLGTVFSTVSGWLRWGGLLAVGGKSALYFFQMGQYQEFVPIAIEYLSGLLIVLLLQLGQFVKQFVNQRRVDRRRVDQRRSAFWICSGIGVSLVAGGIQGARLSIAPFLNHNDLYHLVQMVALYLLYRGVRILKDR